MCCGKAEVCPAYTHHPPQLQQVHKFLEETPARALLGQPAALKVLEHKAWPRPNPQDPMVPPNTTYIFLSLFKIIKDRSGLGRIPPKRGPNVLKNIADPPTSVWIPRGSPTDPPRIPRGAPPKIAQISTLKRLRLCTCRG